MSSGLNVSCADIEQVNGRFYGHPGIKNAIVAISGIVSMFGVFGNALVILSVIRAPSMRTPRNYFIINLAVSDLSLCCVTLPLTIYSLLYMLWPFGWLTCKVMAVLQGVNIFVSTMSITAIGLDRYLVVILVPTNAQRQKLATTLCFVGVWTASFLLAMPVCFFTGTFTLKEFIDIDIDDDLERCNQPLQVCTEYAQTDRRAVSAYSVSCFLFQYCLPLLTLTFTYSRVLGQIRSRISFRKRANGGKRTSKVEKEAKRQHRANLLVVLIIVIFAIVWLPFNVRNIINTFKIDLRQSSVQKAALNLTTSMQDHVTSTPRTTTTTTSVAYSNATSSNTIRDGPVMNAKTYSSVLFAACYITAMLSACANPILYGILNNNFRYEFAKLLQLTKCCPEKVETLRLEQHGKPKHSKAVAERTSHGRNSLVDGILSKRGSKDSATVRPETPEEELEETKPLRAKSRRSSEKLSKTDLDELMTEKSVEL